MSINKNNPKNILIVDLNNEASYPTLAIGYLATPLIKAGYKVEVFSPLAHGIKPLARDMQETLANYIVSRIQFAANPLVEWANEYVLAIYNRMRFRVTRSLVRALEDQLEQSDYDGILVSSYLQYRQLLCHIAAAAKKRDIPLLLGGPYFNQKKVTEQWIDIPGVTAVYGGEPDYVLPDIVEDLVLRRDLKRHPGIFKREITVLGQPAPPIALTDALPIPDFRHFEWERFPNRILPVMAGRGCGWGHCLFCSDVTTASTRTFRSRSVASVLNELQIQAERYAAKDFIFFDSKLNSDHEMWFGIINNFQAVIPGGNWVASVHVDGKGPNGLDRESLNAAAKSGLKRISFGLETGSQRLNKLMLKGTSIDRTSQFVQDAREAGISVRTTIILGYPGETAEDIDQTTEFLRTHRDCLDRVKLSKFKAIPGTSFETRFDKKPEKYPSVISLTWDYTYARAKFVFQPPEKRRYRKSKAQLLRLVYAINRKPLMDSAQQFNGLM